MRTIFLVLIVCFISTSFSAKLNYCNKKGPTYSVSFYATYNGSYCGGARPQQQILDELAKPKNLINTTLKISPIGRKGSSIKVKTDGNGKCQLKLTEGEWAYTLTKDIDKSVLYINKKCSRAISKGYGTFKIGQSNHTPFELFFHFDCDPCDPNSKIRP
jgi:hypothetical protein